MSTYGVTGALDDNADSTADASITQSLSHGANRVNFFLLAKYDYSEIAQSPIACEWAVVESLAWLFRRRGNPLPVGLAADLKEAEAAMSAIQKGEATLPDAAPLATNLPSWENVRVDRNFRFGKNRVIRRESDPTPNPNPELPDYPSEFGIYW